MLTLRGTINDSSGARYVDATSDGNNNLFVVSTQPRFLRYNLSTLQLMASSSTLVSSPAGVVLLSGGASAVVPSSSSSQVDLVELSTCYRTQVTTGASTVVSNVINQQVAPGLTNKAVSTRSTTGTVQRIDASGATMTVASVTVAALSGQTARCIIPTGDGRYFIGTSNGKVHTINDTGFTYQTVDIPNTPNVSTPTIHVNSLSYKEPYLLIGTGHGATYLWNYSSSAIVSETMGGMNDSSSSATCFSNNASGMCLWAKSLAPGVSAADVSEITFERGAITFASTFFNEINVGYNSIGLDVPSNIGWILANTTTANYQLRTFDVTPNNKIQVPTAIQRLVGPSFIYVGGRIIRLRDDGIGKAVVELGTTIGASQTDLTATEGRNYIELALTSGPDDWDVREFLA